jgi:septum formation protein
MVIIDDETLGKPRDFNEAFEFLRRLSGRSHQVKTALFLINCKTLKHDQELATSKVYFRNIENSEILNYVNSGETMDKAGGYGIQGIGGTFVDKVDGEMDTVVGLPLSVFKKILTRNNWDV